MLMRFYKLWDEVQHFMEVKGKPVRKFKDSKWLCDLAFMTWYVTKHLSELNIKLLDSNQLLSSLLSNIKSLDGRLRL